MIIDPAFIMQFLNIINEILAPNKHNINFGSLNMTVQRMPNILQYVLQYALAVSYRIAIRLQPQYPPLLEAVNYIVDTLQMWFSDNT